MLNLLCKTNIFGVCMSEKVLSSSLEDYLECVYNRINTNGSVKAVEISKELNVSRASVTEALNKLAQKEYINYGRYEMISMTDSGIQKAKEIMEELNSYGIKFFLDDFGTGFSNLKAVLSLPFYLIKIDKSLLDAAKENTRNQQILGGVVKAINSIGMKTLIEGVETKEDVELVKNFGVNYIQGYYYHKPSNMTELNKTIEEKV